MAAVSSRKCECPAQSCGIAPSFYCQIRPACHPPRFWWSEYARKCSRRSPAPATWRPDRTAVLPFRSCYIDWKWKTRSLLVTIFHILCLKMDRKWKIWSFLFTMFPILCLEMDWKWKTWSFLFTILHISCLKMVWKWKTWSFLFTMFHISCFKDKISVGKKIPYENSDRFTCHIPKLFVVSVHTRQAPRDSPVLFRLTHRIVLQQNAHFDDFFAFFRLIGRGACVVRVLADMIDKELQSGVDWIGKKFYGVMMGDKPGRRREKISQINNPSSNPTL